MFAIVILSPDQLEFLKTVAYINSYDQKQVLPNQTKPTHLTVQTKFVKTSVHNIWNNFCLVKYAQKWLSKLQVPNQTQI